MKKLFIISAVLTSCIAVSCGYLFREVATGNSCKKCEVRDNDGTGSVVWSEDDCGGGVHRMEDRCKIAAYDFGCNHKCSCETYKQETTE